MDEQKVRAMLRSQYHASLAMLRACIEQCPDSLWYDTTPANAFWRVAYHTIFFTHLYLHQSVDTVVHWPGHQSNVQHEDGLLGEVEPESKFPLSPNPYSREQALEYLQICEDFVDRAVAALDLNSETCGFHWYKISKFEHQLVNLRHAQHGVAQLADRLRASMNIGIRWVGSRRT